MATIEDLVEDFVTLRAPGWLVLSEDEAMNSALRAARFFAGYGSITSIKADNSDPILCILAIRESTKLTVSEWAVIMPLFVLYLEFENAQRLEASRGNGVDVYGRSVSEVSQAITEYENSMPSRAFESDVQILGFNGGSDLPPPYYFSIQGAIPLLPADGV